MYGVRVDYVIVPAEMPTLLRVATASSNPIDICQVSASMKIEFPDGIVRFTGIKKPPEPQAVGEVMYEKPGGSSGNFVGISIMPVKSLSFHKHAGKAIEIAGLLRQVRDPDIAETAAT